MATKSKQKGKAKNKEKLKIRKKTERSYGDGVRLGRGEKRVINPKRHKNSHTKGTRK